MFAIDLSRKIQTCKGSSQTIFIAGFGSCSAIDSPELIRNGPINFQQIIAIRLQLPKRLEVKLSNF